MKSLALAAALAGTCVLIDRLPPSRGLDPRRPSTEPERFDLSTTGIEWHRGLGAAAGGSKPILLLHVIGNFDEVFC